MEDKFKGITITVDGIEYKQYTEMSGSYHYIVGDVYIYATPYFETDEPIVPIAIINDEGEIFNSEYSFFNIENEVEEYINLVKMLITNILIKS